MGSKTTLLESMMQLIKYEGTMAYKNTILKKIKDAAKHMYLVYQNPELQFITNSLWLHDRKSFIAIQHVV